MKFNSIYSPRGTENFSKISNVLVKFKNHLAFHFVSQFHFLKILMWYVHFVYLKKVNGKVKLDHSLKNILKFIVAIWEDVELKIKRRTNWESIGLGMSFWGINPNVGEISKNNNNSRLFHSCSKFFRKLFQTC